MLPLGTALLAKSFCDKEHSPMAYAAYAAYQKFVYLCPGPKVVLAASSGSFCTFLRQNPAFALQCWDLL